MICRRHNAVATNAEHGIPYCLACFAEARTEAIAQALERSIAALRAHNVSDLVRRLGGRKG